MTLDFVKTEDIEKIEEMTSESPYITKPGSQSDDREYYLLKDDDEVVGCGYIRTFLRKIGTFGAVYIVKERRSEGLGKKLTRKLEEKLKEKDVWLILIGVHNDNKKGLRFWKSNDYEVLLNSANEPITEFPFDASILDKISPVPVPDKEVTILYKQFKEFSYEDSYESIEKIFEEIKSKLSDY